MFSTKTWYLAIVATLVVAGGAIAAPLNYPGVYPPPGGVTLNISGASPSDAGGSSYVFTAFDPMAFTSLYWGTFDDNSVFAGLDGTAHPLAFSSASGTTATWSGTTSYTNPQNNSTSTVPVEMIITVSGLGATPWTAAAPLGLPAGMGAVVDNSAGADFTANVQFLADVGSGFVALNSISVGGGLANASVSGGFFASVPEPSSVALCLAGVSALALSKVIRRKR